jgi:hypothetical protein
MFLKNMNNRPVIYTWSKTWNQLIVIPAAEPELEIVNGFISPSRGSMNTTGVKFTNSSGLLKVINGKAQAAASPKRR